MKQANSIPTRTLEVLADLTDRLGHTAGLADVHEAYERAHGPTDRTAISHALSVLVDRGEVTKHGRNRRLRYRVADSPVPHRDPDDPLPALLEIVREETADRREAVSASVIHTRAQAAGIDLSRDQIRTRLETLARDSDRKKERATGSWGEPQVERIREQSRGGHGRVYWRPVGTTYSAPDRRSKRDLLRSAIQRVGELLRRPATREEIRRWANGPGGDTAMAAAVLARHASRRFSAVTTRDSTHGGPVVVVTTELTSRGSYPARYGWETVPPAQRHLCQALDAAALLQPEKEERALRRLPLMEAYLSREFLSLVEEARRSAFHSAAAMYVPADIEWTKVLQIQSRAVQQLTDWTLQGVEEQFKKDVYIGGLRDSLNQLKALQAVPEPSGGAGAIAHLGHYSGTSLEDLQEVALQVVRLTGSALHHWRALFTGVRRLRGPLAGGIAVDDLDDTRSYLDRPEALLHAVRQAQLPRLNALAVAGGAVLGSAVRDQHLLLHWLEDEALLSPSDRDAVVVALGLLGDLPGLETIWGDPVDAKRTAAVIAAVALGVDSRDHRLRLLESVERAARGSAIGVAEQALFREQTGNRLAVLD